MNLAQNLVKSADADPAKIAIKLDDAEVSYGVLAAAASRLAGWLAELGVQPGDRVAVTLPNIPQMPIIYYGILWAGGVVVPMNPLYKSREFAYVLRDAEAKVFFAWDGVADEASAGASDAGVAFVPVSATGFVPELMTHEPGEFVDRDASDTAVVLYTSGTTGSPKGAELTHDNMMRNAEISTRLIDASPDDVIFGGLPLFHSFGQTVGMNAGILAGATMTLVPRFEPTKALEVLQRDQVTIMLGVPTMYIALLQHPDKDEFDLSSLRVCASGGASLPVEVLKGFEQAFGAVILEGYGLSETSPVASFNHADRGRKAGSIGQPVDGVEFRLIDNEWNDVAEGEIGEIAIKGHNVMKGYLGNPEATEWAIRDGWFRSGDLARRDADGFYFIVDRAKDMIIRGGYNVYPREVEEVLYEHPAVATAAVVGIPHPELGEEVAAAITIKSDATLTEDEVRDFVKERVAAYKYPRVVWITSELPMGPTGKILKRQIQIPVDAEENA
ncbi:MAG: long-chain fatty acid--CoA ligase [Actinobacteria bacterium]|nr:long-chain fatty acid--CoA ligase [Actinomycetota bacterium]MCB9411903.1 long-chain fatty acid--CoA ligase [Actinomycetota bacterium]